MPPARLGIVASTRFMALKSPRTASPSTPLRGLTDTAQPRYGMTEEEIAASNDLVPLGRIAQPEDMLPTILFLYGGGAYIRGQTHHVNGGVWMP